ncbi:hypothetical protein NDU88_006823 [Pleurodeles waltl]|uniref:C3H1-type domain-containing protein n=1 Tax=Pleurodeles waltl TaxID=8319 RepID=A0AAV7SR04_PLEWA|nr:hypothetical protein NDU88_006823 [Pleurodeles waltl]
MEEDHAAEQQDDLESMIAHMRAEALKRGNDWLRTKMEDKSREPTERMEDTTSPPEKTPERAALPPQKPSRRRRAEGKQASNPTKKARVVIQNAEVEAAASPTEGVTSAPAEGEHISAIIKECFKSLAPLLLRRDGAGSNVDRTQPMGRHPNTPTNTVELPAPSDPLSAWGAPARTTAPNTGNPPESYARPSLGPASMTTKAAGLATAIPFPVKERIWRKEFIDIFTLLEIQLEGIDLTVCDKKDDDRRERKRARKERNFENWLDAFRIMACVIVEKFPHCAADLWLYESKIHEAHRQFPGDAWLEYDKSFRLKMQAHPEMEWNQEDVSSYIHKMMVAREVNAWAGRGDQPFRNGFNKGRHEKFKAPQKNRTWHSAKPQGEKGSQAICWKFDTEECSWGQNCKFKHCCSTCGGDHPASTCRKSRHKSDKKDRKKKH